MTDDLIAQLSSDLRPVPTSRLRFWLLAALAIGAVAAFAIMLPWIGLRRDLPGAFANPIFWTKFGYTLAFAIFGFWSAERLSRPGGSLRLPILGAILLVAITGIATRVVLISPVYGKAPRRRATMRQARPWRSNDCPRRCVTNAPTVEEVRCCTEDEGRPLEAGGQAQVSNLRKLRS